jgi:glycosyltransferase involved in cell wall biosynthesis/O-antigen/teichoic acid export membrane protein
MRARTLLDQPRALEAVLVALQALAFGSSILIARSAGPTGRGQLVSLTIWTQVLGWLGAFSLDKALIVMSRPPRSEFEPVLGLVTGASLVRRFSIVAALVALWFGTTILDRWELGAIMALGVVTTAHTEIWNGYLLASKRKADYLALRLMQPVIFAGTVLVVILLSGSATTQRRVDLFAIGFLLSILLPVTVSFARHHPSAVRTREGIRWRMFAFARGVQVASILQYLNARLDLLALPFRVSPAALGLYAVGAAPAQALIFLGSAGALRGLTGEAERRDMRAIAAVAVLASVWFFLAPSVIPLLFGDAFRGSIPVARILAIGAVAGFALQEAGGRLVGDSRPGALAIAQGIGAGTFLVGFLIANTITGVAVASAVSYVVSLVGAELFLARRTARTPSPHDPPIILTFSNYYLPGFRGGGPIRSVSELAAALGEEFRFFVVTADRDFGSKEPYPNIDPGDWNQVGKARVRYLGPKQQTFRSIRDLMRSTPHDVLYFNSLFSWRFTIKPLVMRRLGLISGTASAVVAPRGELYAGALELKRTKKRLFLAAARLAGLYKGVVWHATSEDEVELIRRVSGPNASIIIAAIVLGDMEAKTEIRSPKQRGDLRALYLSRIAPKKNIVFGIDALTGLRGRVRYDIYGPMEDPTYWRECEQRIAKLPPHVHVAYKGEVAHEEVGSTFAAYDLFLFPTLGENFGHAIREALAAGCPILISDRTPWRGLQESGAGWDLRLDLAAFTEVLQRCIDMNEEEWKVMSNAARRHAQEAKRTGAAIDQNRQLFFSAIGRQVSDVPQSLPTDATLEPPFWVE